MRKFVLLAAALATCVSLAVPTPAGAVAGTHATAVILGESLGGALELPPGHTDAAGAFLSTTLTGLFGTSGGGDCSGTVTIGGDGDVDYFEHGNTVIAVGHLASAGAETLSKPVPCDITVSLTGGEYSRAGNVALASADITVSTNGSAAEPATAFAVVTASPGACTINAAPGNPACAKVVGLATT